jgi:Na+/proline symporter
MGKRFTAILVALVMFFLPFFVERALAQVAEAQAQALADTNGTLWLAIGCVLGIIGVVIAMVSSPTAPGAAFIGQPPDYIMAYTNTYQQAAKSIQQNKALLGCVLGYGVVAALYLLVFAAAASTANSY